MSYYAIYSKDRKIVVCCVKSTANGTSITRSYRQGVDEIDKSLKIRVLKTIKGQEPYLEVTNRVSAPYEFEIVETDVNGVILDVVKQL